MKVCPYCVEEIQDAAIVCKHCDRDVSGITKLAPTTAGSGLAGPGRRTAVPRTVVLCVLLAAALGVAAIQFSRDPVPEALPPQLPPPPPPPTRIDIASHADLDIGAGATEHFEWTAPVQQPHCHLTGRIEVVAGGNKDIQVFVLDADEFQNLSNGHTARSFLSTEKTTVVTLDVRTSYAGGMVLALGNTFSAFTGKRVQLRDVVATCS